MPEARLGAALLRIRSGMGRQPDARHLNLLRTTSLIAGIVIFIVWYLDESQGMTTAWESTGVALMGGVYLLGGMLLWLRGTWVHGVTVACLASTSIYFLGMLHYAVKEGGTLGLYSLATNAQFIPMLYVSAFVALQRGAATFSWLHYAGTVLLYVANYGVPEWRRLYPVPGDTLGHTWLIVLLAHPCYILALQYITMLRGRLRRSEQLAHAEKQRFLAMLSHEIRSPLQAMLGSIDLLALKVQQPPEQRAVDRLRHAANQLEAHLRDVTEFTRLEDPAWQLHAEATDLNRLVRDTCETWQAAASARQLTLRCDIEAADEPVLAQAWTDPQRVRQILGNLLSNAVKYTPSGHIQVHTSLAEDGEHLLLAVSDTGVGIPGHELSRIFEPYVRLENQRAGRVEGSGLGLAVVHRLVDRLGGELHVDSQPDQGTRFQVRLPLRSET